MKKGISRLLQKGGNKTKTKYDTVNKTCGEAKRGMKLIKVKKEDK